MHADLERLLSEAELGRQIELDELEVAYTSACAEVLRLEAEALRTQQRLNELRGQLRHVRTAVEWMHEQRTDPSATR